MASKKKLRVPFATITRIPKKEPAKPPVEHGIEVACYSNSGFGYQPHIVCLCGWNTEHACDNWEDAGAMLDEHLAETANG
jgi:hypothetical protein